MSRHGYSDDGDCETWAMIRWRGAALRAIRGRRGQAFLRELVAALDSMPVKRLIAHSFVASDDDGVCALGCVAKARGLDTTRVEERAADGDVVNEEAGHLLGIAPSLAAEVMYANDEGVWRGDRPAVEEARWRRVRAWAARHLEAT